MDLRETIAPRSDQLNADDFIGGPQLVTIVEVRKGSTEQPVSIVTEQFGPGRPFKPSKSMRRVLVHVWGHDGDIYRGRQLVLYRDPTIKFGGEEVGGIRISHMSHLDKPTHIALTVSKGTRRQFLVEPIAAAAVEAQDGPEKLAARVGQVLKVFGAGGVTQAMLENHQQRPAIEWTARDLAELGAVFDALKSGTMSKVEVFPELDQINAADLVDGGES